MVANVEHTPFKQIFHRRYLVNSEGEIQVLFSGKRKKAMGERKTLYCNFIHVFVPIHMMIIKTYRVIPSEEHLETCRNKETL